MKKGLIIILLITLLLATAISTKAWIVVDYPNLAQNTTTALNSIKTVINTAAALAKQAQMIANQIKNLTHLDGVLTANSVVSLQNCIQSIKDINQKTKAIMMNYKNIQQNWDVVYKSFTDYNGMSAKDYYKQAQIVTNQTDQAIYDAMKSQGLVAGIDQDAQNLERLLSASQRAPGALAATQAANQIAVVQTQQLMRLQQVFASSYRAQTSYYAQVVQKETAARAYGEKNKIKKPSHTLRNSKGKPLGKY